MAACSLTIRRRDSCIVAGLNSNGTGVAQRNCGIDFPRLSLNTRVSAGGWRPRSADGTQAGDGGHTYVNLRHCFGQILAFIKNWLAIISAFFHLQYVKWAGSGTVQVTPRSLKGTISVTGPITLPS